MATKGSLSLSNVLISDPERGTSHADQKAHKMNIFVMTTALKAMENKNALWQ